ncbi:odorant receptor 46a [Drosophila innubila]|uniref:odorant receptor 46a n=1 Tax=Drosophila innubila TaxID=198719 RepID=UPI00148BD181|nr:odorant receptor 46a [Drosophila innubila]
MNEVVKGFFVLSTCIGYTLKVFSVKVNNVALLQLFDNLRDAHFRPGNAEEQLIFEAARRLSRFIFKYYGITSVTALTTVLISQYAIDKTQLPLATYNPFSGERGTFGYYFMYLYQCIALSGACFLNISFDSLCCSMFIFVKCQLDILAMRLQKLGHNADKADETKLQLQLKNCIEYYTRIVELSADIESLVYKPISAQIFCSILVLTANFYAMSLLSDEKLVFLKYFIYQSCMLLQIFLLCYFAGEIAQRSSELPHELYRSNWVSWRRCNRRLMLMFLQRLDLPIRIRTLNASHAFDLALFSSALATTVKIQVVLVMMNREENNKLTESFYKYQVLYFKILGLWKLHPDATRRQRWLYQLRFGILFGGVALLLLFFAIRVLVNIDQLRVILQVFFMFATEVSCMFKLLNIRLRQQEHEYLRNEMHSGDLLARSPREFCALKDAAKESTNIRNCYCVMSILAATLILVTQLFSDSGSLPITMYEPCNLSTFSCYYGLYVYQVVTVFPTCLLNIAFDSMAQGLLNFVRAQLIVLSMRLANLGAAQTPRDDHRIALELRDCCIYFRRIERLRDLMDGFIKVPYSVQLICSILVLVSNFYAMSTNSGETLFMIKMGTYQFDMLLQIFMICYAANEVTHQSSLLTHALYKSDWITWNKSNRKMCLLMMLRFNSPLIVRTIDHTTSFSLPTFASIVNCSYSYFALLKRVNS